MAAIKARRENVKPCDQERYIDGDVAAGVRFEVHVTGVVNGGRKGSERRIAGWSGVRKGIISIISYRLSAIRKIKSKVILFR